MKSTIMIVVLSLFSMSTFAASVTTFICQLEAYPKQLITFKMQDLGSSSMTFLNVDPNDSYSEVFTTKSSHETIKRLVSTLNGQGGDLRVGADRISFFGDDAGIEFAYLDLFKNTGYRSGFVRMEFNFGEDKQYSKLNCILR